MSEKSTYNLVSTLVPSFPLGSSSLLQVTRTTIKAHMRSNFDQIGVSCPCASGKIPIDLQWEKCCDHSFAKCHSMRVTRNLPNLTTLHQQKLEQVSSTKYLGITLKDNLDLGQHISVSSKATKTMGFLWRHLTLAHMHTV